MLRVFNHYFSSRKFVFFMAEWTAIAFACGLGAFLLSIGVHPTSDVQHFRTVFPAFIALSCGFAIIFQFCLYILDLYDFRVAASDRLKGYRMLKATGIALALVGIGALILHQPIPSGGLMGGAMGALCGAILARVSMPSMVGGPSNVLLIGNGPRALSIKKAVEEQGEDAFRICGMLATVPDDLRSQATELKVTYIVVALDDSRGLLKSHALLDCRMNGVKVYDVPGFTERVIRRIPVSYLRASDVIYSDSLTPGHLIKVSKRVFDVFVSLFLLSQAFPTMMLLAIAIKIDSKGPIFYRQERVGYRGKSYWLWKFRSMRTDAEKDGAVWARKNDDRVTRIGRIIRKTRIDELPQIFNVLIGEMSFVGPRPERPVFVNELKEKIPFYGLREAVKPGITGWAQIRYPYGASVEDAQNKLEFDLYYIKNGSLFLDVAIIFHTVRHVLLGRGAR